MIRRFLTRTLLLILIAACGCNGWQVHQLQDQVARLQSQAAAARDSQAREPGGPDAPAHVDRSWLGQADRHAALARAAVLRADLPTAQRELQRGVDDMHRAIRGPEKTTQAALGQAQHTLAALQSQTQNLWRKVHPARPAPAQ